MKKIKFKLVCVCAALITLLSHIEAENVQVDEKLTFYTKTENIDGTLTSVGSDTLNNLMIIWAESFRLQYPHVRIQIEGKGSSTAPAALIEGTALIGPMSRPMKNSEIDKFEKKYGFEPVKIGVALDTLAVYVNKDNPISKLSLQQVDAIFSRNRKGGIENPIKTWGDLGETGSLSNKPISLYGRNAVSGTYGHFKSKALFKGDFKDTVKEQPGSASVVLGVSEDPAGCGYSGIGYKTSGVRAIPLSKTIDGEAFSPTYWNLVSGDYPLSRMLYIYFMKEPNKPIDPLVREFLLYTQSREGQQIVVLNGYLPLPSILVDKNLELLD